MINNNNHRKALSLLSLNGNSFFKVSNPSSRHHLIRYIRSKSPTFVALQEIDQSSDSFQHQNILHQQFCCQQSLWTEYCGLLCFDPQFILSRIPLPEDSRCILAKVTHIEGSMDPFHILVIYAPASSSKARAEFFDTILTFRQLSPYDTLSCVDRMIIAGDFNYALPSFSTPRTTRHPQHWLHFLQCHFRNVISELRGLDTPTFRRGDTTRSAIDYLYISLDLSVHYVDAEVEFLNPQWTDHALLGLTFQMDLSTTTGPGLWRANPIYVANKDFMRQFDRMLKTFTNMKFTFHRCHHKNYGILSKRGSRSLLKVMVANAWTGENNN